MLPEQPIDAEQFRGIVTERLTCLGLRENEIDVLTQIDDYGRLTGESTIHFRECSASAPAAEILKVIDEAIDAEKTFDALVEACRRRNMLDLFRP